MGATHEEHDSREFSHPAPPMQSAQPSDEVLRMGAEEQLVGILSRPARASLEEESRKPSFVILNAGVLHRIGPHRVHVTLARRIAALGLTALRLDLGGIGDSTASSSATNFRESAVADTRVAMTGLTEAVGAKRFVLFGICSGADNAIATALVDDRVAGVVLVDPPTYATRRGRLRHLRSRFAERSPRELLRWGASVAERRLRRAASRVTAGAKRGEAEDVPSEGREPPPIATYRAQLTTLVDRGVRVLAVFSGIHGPRYNHPAQLFEVVPALRGRLDHAYFPTANHTFTERAAQAELIETVSSWTKKQFG